MTVTLIKKYLYRPESESVGEFATVQEALEHGQKLSRDLHTKLWPRRDDTTSLDKLFDPDYDYEAENKRLNQLRNRESATFSVDADDNSWDAFVDYVIAENHPSKCKCAGYFGGEVTSINPLRVSCSSTGDDCIVILHHEDGVWRVIVGCGMSDSPVRLDNPDELEHISVGDIALDLQYGCHIHEPFYDRIRQLAKAAKTSTP